MEPSLLLVSDGLIHPPLLGRYWLTKLLQPTPYTFRTVPSLESLVRRALDPIKSIVLYIHQKRISPAALGALESYLQSGGGLLAIHSASASFKGEPRYFSLLGGRFLSHGRVRPVRVQPAEAPDPIFGDIKPFSIRDELYRHEYDAQNRVHFWVSDDDRPEPLVWTRRCGEGRVCYCAAGHTPGSLRHPSVRRILQRGVAWTAGDLTSPEWKT